MNPLGLIMCWGDSAADHTLVVPFQSDAHNKSAKQAKPAMQIKTCFQPRTRPTPPSRACSAPSPCHPTQPLQQPFSDSLFWDGRGEMSAFLLPRSMSLLHSLDPEKLPLIFGHKKARCLSPGGFKCLLLWGKWFSLSM